MLSEISQFQKTKGQMLFLMLTHNKVGRGIEVQWIGQKGDEGKEEDENRKDSGMNLT